MGTKRLQLGVPFPLLLPPPCMGTLREQGLVGLGLSLGAHPAFHPLSPGVRWGAVSGGGQLLQESTEGFQRSWAGDMIALVILKVMRAKGGQGQRLYHSMGAILITLCVNGNPLGLCSAQPVQPAMCNSPA